MELLTKEQCERGMEVQLIDPRYVPTIANPTKGSKFECTGVITSVNFNHYIRVAWKNGMNNCYKDKELMAVMDKYQSIW